MYGKKKGSRALRKSEGYHRGRSKKRKPPVRSIPKVEDKTTDGSSTKKLKQGDELLIPIDETIAYRILNFTLVFTTLSQLLVCRECHGDIKFKTACERGLGFVIVLKCSCGEQLIYSCSLIGKAYEVNKRFVFVMKTLGLGFQGAQKFCALMDIPTFLTHTVYHNFAKNMSVTIKAVAKKFFRKDFQEEVTENLKEKTDEKCTDEIAARVFDKNPKSFLYMLKEMGVELGRCTHNYVRRLIHFADTKTKENSEEQQTMKRQRQMEDSEEDFEGDSEAVEMPYSNVYDLGAESGIIYDLGTENELLNFFKRPRRYP